MDQHIKLSNALKWLGLSVQCLVGAFLLWWLTSRSDLDSEQLMYRFEQASFVPLALGTLCFITNIAVGALRYYLFLPPSTSIIYLFGTNLLQNAMLTFMPWRIGELSYPMLLRRDYNISITNSGSVLLAIRLTDLLILLTVGLLGSGKFSFDRSVVGISFGAILLIVFFLAVSVTYTPRNSSPLVLQKLIVALEPLRTPRRFVSFMLLSVAVFTLATIQSAFILNGLAFPVSIPDIALLNALTLLSALLPIHPPGGWGTIDSIQVVILERLSYSPEASTSAILAAHAFYTLLIVTGGFIGWQVRGKILTSIKTAF